MLPSDVEREDMGGRKKDERGEEDGEGMTSKEGDVSS